MQQEHDLQFYVPIDVMKSVARGSSGEEVWAFEGIASTSDVDLFDEVVYPESYTDTVDFFKSNGKIYFNHDYARKDDGWMTKFDFTKEEILDLKTPIGKPTEAEIRPEGLYIKGLLNKAHPIAQRVWKQFLNNPDNEFRGQMGLSIGAKYKGQPRREYDVKKGKYVTYLPDLLLYEVSLTPEPVNPHTWATALKSLAAGSTTEGPTSMKHHTISPETTVFDSENGQLVVKSVVHSDDGSVHVFEQYINLKEDVKNVDNEKVVLKADLDLEDEEELVLEDVPMEIGDEDAPVEGLADDVEGVDEMGAEEALGEDEEDIVGEEEILGGGGEDEFGGDLGDEGEEGDGLLDALVDADESGTGDTDAAMQLVMDKLDILIDLLTMSDRDDTDIVETSSHVEEVPSEQIEAFKSVLDERIPASGISLDKESMEQMAEVIKSLAEDVALKVYEKLSTETTVVKSTGTGGGSGIPQSPGVALSGESYEEVPGTVKSVTGAVEEADEERGVALKSFVESYRNVRGHTPDKIQERATIVSRATEALGISSDEFSMSVRAADYSAKRNY